MRKHEVQDLDAEAVALRLLVLADVAAPLEHGQQPVHASGRGSFSDARQVG